jgi:hypothetical protein
MVDLKRWPSMQPTTDYSTFAEETLMAVDWKRLALDPTDHELLDPETLHTRIARYVAVRRERGEQMKVIVPAAATRFGVSKEMVQAAMRKTRLHGPMVNCGG